MFLDYFFSPPRVKILQTVDLQKLQVYSISLDVEPRSPEPCL